MVGAASLFFVFQMVNGLTDSLWMVDLSLLAIIIQDFESLIRKPCRYLVRFWLIGGPAHLLFIGQKFTSLHLTPKVKYKERAEINLLSALSLCGVSKGACPFCHTTLRTKV